MVRTRRGKPRLWTLDSDATASAARLCHYDASDMATMFQTSGSAVTAVSATGDPVGYWKDKSGNGRHLGPPAANDARRPTFQRNGDTKMPMLTMATNDALVWSGSDIALTIGYYAFFVGSIDPVVTANRSLVCLYKVAGNDHYFYSDGTDLHFNGIQSRSDLEAADYDSASHVWSVVATTAGSGGFSRLRYQGDNDTSGTSPYTAGAIADIAIGTRIIGHGSYTSDLPAGRISEFAVLDASLMGADHTAREALAAKIVTELMEKWYVTP